MTRTTRPAPDARTTRRLIILCVLGITLISAAAIAAIGGRLFPAALESISTGTAPQGIISGALYLSPTTDDGVIEAGQQVSVFDDSVPAVAKLDPRLLDAIRAAATDASAEGIAFQVNSGWRSTNLQRHLLDEAIATYGSREEAARWVATPETSSHVSGEAIDIGTYDAAYWLTQNGAAYDLCQTYSNEPWHFEVRLGASTEGCPEPYLDPTEDPRLNG